MEDVWGRDGSPGRLWVLGALVTALLNLDTAVVLLTPLYARIDRRLAVQPMLLRALETGVVQPLGDERERKLDVRIVAATERELERASDGSEFRLALLQNDRALGDWYALAASDLSLYPLAVLRGAAAGSDEAFSVYARSSAATPLAGNFSARFIARHRSVMGTVA